MVIAMCGTVSWVLLGVLPLNVALTWLNVRIARRVVERNRG